MPKGEKGTSRPYLRGKTWWIRYSVPGEAEERRESSGSTSKNDAIRLLNQRRSQIDRREMSSSNATVGDLFDPYSSDKRNRGQFDAVVEGYLRLHLRPAFGKIRASQFDTALINRFIEQKRQSGYATSSINRWLEVLRRSFNLGLRNVPPFVTAVPQFEKLPENNTREGFLEYIDYVALRDALPEHQQLLLVIGYHLGMRRGEILALRWDQVDWEHNLIRLEKPKPKRSKLA